MSLLVKRNNFNNPQAHSYSQFYHGRKEHSSTDPNISWGKILREQIFKMCLSSNILIYVYFLIILDVWLHYQLENQNTFVLMSFSLYFYLNFMR